MADSGPQPPLDLAALQRIPVTQLKGVGDRKAKGLAANEVETLLDLLTYYPRRYLDRTREALIAELMPGEEASVLVSIVRTSSRRVRNKVIVTSTVSDGSSSLQLVFFNQPWRERQLLPGHQAVLYGKLELFRGQRQMSNPVVDLVGDKTGRILPVYAQSEKTGIYTWDVAEWVAEALRRTVLNPGSRGILDPLPADLVAEHRFLSRQDALVAIHQPESMADVAQARRRLVFDELLRMQLALVLRKRAIERTAVGIAHQTGGPLVERFTAGLPFPLTGAQRRAIAEIAADLARPVPMHRLLQGDVGAGKTLVAVATMLAAVDGGHQAALMAPTEVLAEQHHLGIRKLLEGLTVEAKGSLFAERPLRVELLTNRVGTADRRRILAELLGGAIDIAVGTHALIQEGVMFGSLGVVVIDEQHRFGVEQRAVLRERTYGEGTPDVLVMTATPIPRTAAMTVYGDLDVSVLDELPPGRTPIVTRWVKASGSLEGPEVGESADLEAEADLEAMWAEVRGQIAEGRQVYVVCPLIDVSDKLEVASAEEMFDRLLHGELAGTRMGLLHGRLNPADKDQTMELFRTGHLDVLVATTVIEVGVDVPNATVMVILDADRFGIAQLHQLRGRVGRGAHASVCWLVGSGATPDGEARLQALVDSTDGFELAEVDLDLRGEGTILGERQKGRNDLKLASLRRDRDAVVAARRAAIDIVDADPFLTRNPPLAAELQLFLEEADADFLLKG